MVIAECCRLSIRNSCGRSLEPFSKSVTLSLMKAMAFFTLLALAWVPISAQEAYQAKEIQEAEKKGGAVEGDARLSLDELGALLASDDFAERNSAGEAIWSYGEEGLDFLQRLTGSNDPELSLRASALRLKIRSGILPDTPPEIASMLGGYFDANTEQKKKIARWLKEREHFEYLLRLNSLEQQEEVKELLRVMVNESIPNLIKKSIAGGDLPRVRELLSFAGDFNGMIRYASFLEGQGELEDEIARLREFDDADSVERYLACLRVKGDFLLLRKEATRLGRNELAGFVAVLMGDPIPLFETCLESQALEKPQKVTLKLLRARALGDQVRAQKMAEMLEETVRDNPDQVDQYFARLGLYMAGLPEVVGRGLKDSDWRVAYEYYTSLDLKEKLPALYGIPNHQFDKKWLEEKLHDLTGEFLQEEGQLEDVEEAQVMRVLNFACAFHEDRGEYEAVSQIISGIFDACRVTGKGDVSELASYYLGAFPQGSLVAVTKEVNNFELNLGGLIRNHSSGRGSRLLWLWSQAKEIKPDLNTLEALQLINGFNGAGTLTREEFADWNDALLKRVMNAEPDQKEKMAASLHALWRRFGPASGQWELLNIPEYGEHRLIEAAWIATQLGRHDEALELLKSGDLGSPEFQNGTILYRLGLSLAHQGENNAAENAFQKADLYGGGTASYLNYNATLHLLYGQNEESYQVLIKAILRTPENSKDRSGMMLRLLDRSLVMEKWAEAAALAQAYHLYTDRNNGGYLLVKAFEARFAQGMVFLKQGKKAEAITALEEAHEMIPASGALGDYFFLTLRKHGLSALHDRLCQKSLDLLRAQVELFPNDHSAKNTFAWVASRANRNLVEAEEMITKALKGDPLSAALLDTCAEVKFAQGKREEAVKWSAQAVNLYVSDPQIHGQLRRFKFGEFPTP